MPKTETERVTEWGLQTPDGQTEWASERVAKKLEWTTPQGRKSVQADFDSRLKGIGVTPSALTALKFFTRERFIAYSEALLVTDEPVTEPVESTDTSAIAVIQGFLADNVEEPTASTEPTEAAPAVVINNTVSPVAPVPPAVHEPIPPVNQ